MALGFRAATALAPESSRKVRESEKRQAGKSALLSMMAAQQGCRSLGEVLVPSLSLQPG